MFLSLIPLPLPPPLFPIVPAEHLLFPISPVESEREGETERREEKEEQKKT